MTKYRVEIDGQTVWSGEGDDYKVIPAQYRDRPANAAAGEPHPSPHYLYESVGDSDVADQLFGIQVSLDHEVDLEIPDHPSTWAALAPKEGN
jgi:hypothetical protein